MFFIVDKGTCHVHPTESAKCVSIYMLGRRLSEYTVIKTDEAGDRIVSIPSPDIVAIEQACIQA